MSERYDSAIIGLGRTGASCLRYLAGRGERLLVVDSRSNPPAGGLVREFDSPRIDFSLGRLDSNLLSRANRLVFSPGVDRRQPPFNDPLLKEQTVLGDIELFMNARRELSQAGKVIAVSGSNGKSTVIDLLGRLLKAAGKRLAVGGNFGTPALDLIDRQGIDFWLLELSSFQLELIDSLGADVALLTNIQPDHLDRHSSMENYRRCKHKLFTAADTCFWNRHDEATRPVLEHGQRGISLGWGSAGEDFRLTSERLEIGQTFSFPLQRLALSGRHNHLNVLFAVAAAYTATGSCQGFARLLAEYSGLPHRCERLPLKSSIGFVNDSKATNVSSACAAVEGLAPPGQENLLLLAGGQAKTEDFSPLAEAARGRVRHMALFGQAAQTMAKSFERLFDVSVHKRMALAFLQLAGKARSGDILLLSPACASLDEFTGFCARGLAFRHLAEQWVATRGRVS